MVKIVKLISGEEIVSDIIENENFLILKNPQKFMITGEGLASMPLLPFSKDKEYKVSLNHVLMIAEPEDEIANSYNSQFGGIVLAKNIIQT
jgi:hypothetical protein